MRNKLLIIPFLLFGLASCSANSNTNTETTTIDVISEDAETLEVTYLNVGKADAIILESNDTFCVIDTGLQSTSSVLINALEEKGCDKIDYLIITHFDKDHVGGAADLVNAYDITNIYTSYYTSESNENAYNNFISAVTEKDYTDRMSIIRETTTFTLGDAEYVIYAPKEESDYSNDPSNNSSLCIKTLYGERAFLFTGDAEKLRIKELIKLDIACDVIKMPHHGGIEDNTNKLIAAADPKYAVITSSDAEPEDTEVVSLLESYGTTVYLTRLGTITMKTDGNLIEINQ